MKVSQAHPQYKINVTYSTPSIYYQAVHDYADAHKTEWDVFSPPDNDFFPYWTGFFTSQSEFKDLVRRTSAFLHTAWAMHTFAHHSDWAVQASLLNVLWGAQAVVQHHDGVSGSSPTKTYVDYIKRLDFGTQVASEQVLAPILGGAGRVVCPPGRSPPMCGGTRNGLAGKGLSVSVTNPIAWERDEWVRLEVPPGAYTVRDAAGAAVPAQTTPLNNGNVTLLWLAKGLAPMGTTHFTVARAAPRSAGASVAATVAPLPAGGASLENEHLRVAVGGDGRIARVTLKATGQALAVSADVLYYQGAQKGQGDDSYDFKSNGTQAHPFPSDLKVQALYLTGPLHSEVRLFSNKASNIGLRVSLSPGDQHVTIDAGVGPVDIVSDGISKDIILRVNTTIESGKYWYTDSQGMEMMRRTRGNGTFNQTVGPTPGKNYYPTTAMTAIRDAKAQLVLSTTARRARHRWGTARWR